ncbi:unnamed protein product [Prunus armeniaca]|nr:unnamed protein product [Prunus armeniaca]
MWTAFPSQPSAYNRWPLQWKFVGRVAAPYKGVVEIKQLPLNGDYFSGLHIGMLGNSFGVAICLSSSMKHEPVKIASASLKKQSNELGVVWVECDPFWGGGGWDGGWGR